MSNACIHNLSPELPVAHCSKGRYGGHPTAAICRNRCPLYEDASGKVTTPMRGAGDLVAKITKAVGIKPCRGCEKRQEWLNELLPFKEKHKGKVIKHRAVSATATILPALPGEPTPASWKELTDSLPEPSNVIVWGGNWNRNVYAKAKATVLFVENGLINQSKGFFIDSTGFFSESSITKQRLWEEPVAKKDTTRIATAIKEWGWEWGQACDQKGPIIVALQRRLDTGCYRFFPSNPSRLDPVDGLLAYCAKYLPKDRKVIIRPHPRFRQEWDAKRDEYKAKHFQPNWEVNLKGSIYPLLLTASALVTVNSTVATEAMALSLPIATMGEGVWTGSGGTLECAQEPAKLAGVLDAKPDMERRQAVMACILRRQVRYGDTAAFAKHPAYLDWLNRLQ